MWGNMPRSSTRALAVVACGTIAAGLGLLLFRRRRQHQSTRDPPQAAGEPIYDDDDDDDYDDDDDGDDGDDVMEKSESKEEGDCPKAEGSNAREKVAQAFFGGVGGVISSAVPFDEDDENSSGEGFDDEEFVDGEENITAMLDRDAAEAADGDCRASGSGRG